MEKGGEKEEKRKIRKENKEGKEKKGVLLPISPRWGQHVLLNHG